MALVQEDLDVVNNAINTAVNGAVAKLKTDIGSDMKAALKPFEGLGATLTSLTENITQVQTKLNETPAPAGDKGGKGGKDESAALPPEVALQIKNLTKLVEDQGKSLKTEQDARVAAVQESKNTAKESKLRSALGQFNFVNPDAAEDAYALLSGKVDWDDNGNLIADGLPMEDFVKDFVPTKKAHLLAPVGKGGAGASGGTRQGAAGTIQLESIKQGMSVDDQKAAAGAIVRALNG